MGAEQPVHVVGTAVARRRLLGVGPRQRVVDEHHVGVAAVAQLVAAVAAHRHHATRVGGSIPRDAHTERSTACRVASSVALVTSVSA